MLICGGRDHTKSDCLALCKGEWQFGNRLQPGKVDSSCFGGMNLKLPAPGEQNCRKAPCHTDRPLWPGGVWQGLSGFGRIRLLLCGSGYCSPAEADRWSCCEVGAE